MATTTHEIAMLAGGCFWGMEDLVRRLPGVVSTRVGYARSADGSSTRPGTKSQAEVVEITFDRAHLSYRGLLKFFFQIHNPTRTTRQSEAVQDRYRSAIFYTNDAQRRVARAMIADIERSDVWASPVVTDVAPAGTFCEVQAGHSLPPQENPDEYTCRFLRREWKLPPSCGSADGIPPASPERARRRWCDESAPAGVHATGKEPTS